MKKYVGIVIIIFIVLVFGAFVLNGLENENSNINESKKDEVKVVKEEYNNTINELTSGKFPNLIVRDKVECNIDEIDNIYDIKITKDMSMYDNTHKQNLERVVKTIENFYGKDFDYSILSTTPIYENDANQENVSLTFERLEQDILDNKFDANKYYILFGDAREIGENGFAQIDSGLFNVWFSRGELDATMPMMSYTTKTVYNLTTGKGNLKDNIELKGETISIEAAIKYVEEFLNKKLPYEKTEDFIYKVAEARVLECEDGVCLGFCVRRTYAGIPFDYIDGSTEGIYNSDFDDDRGEVCMAKVDEIDNFCGLGGSTDMITTNGEKIDQIVSLESALKKISDSIGDNSIYEIYGIEIVYQLVREEVDSENPSYIQIGTPKWKIMARNENDDKYTWFYVDLKNGGLTHRFQQIFEEKKKE